MFLPGSEIQSALAITLAECGVVFRVVKNFTGAPVQGAVLRLHSGAYGMFVTLRGAWADVFWFTIMHEIGHILNGDVDNAQGEFIDYEGNGSDERERLADEFASQALLDSSAYAKFLSGGRFTEQAIKEFASSQSVPPFVVVGRLQKEGIIGYEKHAGLKPRYKWAKKQE